MPEGQAPTSGASEMASQAAPEPSASSDAPVAAATTDPVAAKTAPAAVRTQLLKPQPAPPPAPELSTATSAPGQAAAATAEPEAAPGDTAAPSDAPAAQAPGSDVPAPVPTSEQPKEVQPAPAKDAPAAAEPAKDAEPAATVPAEAAEAQPGSAAEPKATPDPADPPLEAEPVSDDAADDDAEGDNLVMAEDSAKAPAEAGSAPAGNGPPPPQAPAQGQAPAGLKPAAHAAQRPTPPQKQAFDVEQPQHSQHPQHHPHPQHPHVMKPPQQHPQHQHPQHPHKASMMIGGPNQHGVPMQNPYAMHHFPPGAMMTDPFGSMYGYPQPVQFGLQGFPSELADRMRNVGVHPMGAYPPYTMSPHFVNSSMAPQHVQMMPGAQMMQDPHAKGAAQHGVVMPNAPNQHVTSQHQMPHKGRASNAGPSARQPHGNSGRKSRKTNSGDDSRSTKTSGKGSATKQRPPPVSGDYVRYRLPVQSIFYEQGSEDYKVPFRWKSDSLPTNHFRQHGEVRYKPKPKPDFVAFYNDTGAKHRTKPELMFRHKKMSARLEDAVKDLKNFNTILKDTHKKLTSRRVETADTKSQKALVDECDKLLKTCVYSSGNALKHVESSRKSFDSLIDSHVKEVQKMCQKKLAQAAKPAKRKREAD